MLGLAIAASASFANPLCAEEPNAVNPEKIIANGEAENQIQADATRSPQPTALHESPSLQNVNDLQIPSGSAVFQVEIGDDCPGTYHPVERVAFPPLRRWKEDRDAKSRQQQISRMPLPQKLDYCINIYNSEKLEEVDKRSPWGIMHAAISLGQKSQCRLGDRKLNAIEWLLNNGECREMRLMFVDEDGNLRTRSGPGYEGHEGQLLAILAQSGVSPHEKLFVDGREFKVTDLIRKEMDSCRPATELTFKLIGLSYYLDSDATWTSDDGQPWNIQRLIMEELKQPVNGVACGGTHRLMGFSFSIQRREIQGKEIEGEWQRAKEYIGEYHRYAFSLQNPDGSFSTNWFEGREAQESSQRRVQTTGHILEWLVYSLEPRQMRDPRLVKSVNYLVNLMLTETETKWSVGPKGHAIRALDVYRRKLRGESIPQAMFGKPRYR